MGIIFRIKFIWIDCYGDFYFFGQGFGYWNYVVVSLVLNLIEFMVCDIEIMDCQLKKVIVVI